jgi:hypothetical protein
MPPTRIRVTLRYIEVLDRKDFDEYGEFVFRFKTTVPQRDIERAVRIPESGHYSVSDHPSMNKLKLDKVIFEGEVWDGDTMVLEANRRGAGHAHAQRPPGAVPSRVHRPGHGVAGAPQPVGRGER